MKHTPMLNEPSTRTAIAGVSDIQLLEETERTITVKARGDSLKDMANSAFQLMRKQIFKEFEKPIVQMEAKEVYFDELEREETEEHFMLFFWPRTKTSYDANVRIVVSIKYLNINERK